ncbi:hypothetical protein ABG067_003876 [Albugo candida]
MKASVVSDMLPERCPLGLYVGVVYSNCEKTTKAHQILSSIGSIHKEVHISGLTTEVPPEYEKLPKVRSIHGAMIKIRILWILSSRSCSTMSLLSDGPLM